jgi:excisionase family DNA binding protein
MSRNQLTFEQLPEAISKLFEKVENIEKLLQEKSQTPPVTDELYTVGQAADFLSLSKSTIYTMIHKKELPVLKRSKRCYFFRSALIEYLKYGEKKSLKQIETEIEKFNRKKIKLL